MLREANGGRAFLALILCVFYASIIILSVELTVLHAQEGPGANVNAIAAVNTPVKRFALVIGNGAYRNVSSLKNTKSDAAAMATKLENFGYEILYRTDLDRRNMNEAVSTFLARVEPGSEALVYYAGHGVELNGSNYLLPVDIPPLSPDQERMLRTEGFNLTDLLLDLEGRSARVSLVILDACRNNPLREMNGGVATRSLGATRGLGRVDPPRGTFVIFSAGVGEEAIDNLGTQDTNPNGLFTRKLLTLIDQEGLEIRPMVQRLRAEVRQAALSGTGRSQIPSYYDQLLGEFYFQPKSQQIEAIGENSCDRLIDVNASAASLLNADINTGLQACMAASTQFPNEIRFVRRLQAAQEQRMAQKALSSNQMEFSNAYLLLYSSGRFFNDIKSHVVKLGDVPELKLVPNQPTRLVVPAPPTLSIIPQTDIGRVLQAELKRVGCDPEAVDGTWGLASVRAMSIYNSTAHTNLDITQPTLDAVEALRGRSGRVCPLICGQDERIASDACVPMTCNAGFALDSSGHCKIVQNRVKPKPQTIKSIEIHNKLKKLEPQIIRATTYPPKTPVHVRASASTSNRNRNCFMFNGIQQCE